MVSGDLADYLAIHRESPRLNLMKAHVSGEDQRMAQATNPYGDGRASERIVGRILQEGNR
jgi:UDP-N-acetylglucosamine 2-epimerase